MVYHKIVFILLFCLVSVVGMSQAGDHSGSGWNAHLGGNVHDVEGEISIKNSPSYYLMFQRQLPYERAAGLSYTFVATELFLRNGYSETQFYEHGSVL